MKVSLISIQSSLIRVKFLGKNIIILSKLYNSEYFISKSFSSLLVNKFWNNRIYTEFTLYALYYSNHKNMKT